MTDSLADILLRCMEFAVKARIGNFGIVGPQLIRQTPNKRSTLDRMLKTCFAYGLIKHISESVYLIN
jgi:hypothetical protein